MGRILIFKNSNGNKVLLRIVCGIKTVLRLMKQEGGQKSPLLNIENVHNRLLSGSEGLGNGSNSMKRSNISDQ